MKESETRLKKGRPRLCEQLLWESLESWQSAESWAQHIVGSIVFLFPRPLLSHFSSAEKVKSPFEAPWGDNDKLKPHLSVFDITF